jgi:hypothetical protein
MAKEIIRCKHCEHIIEDPKRKKYCSEWCRRDANQPEDQQSWKPNPHPIIEGVYED